MAALQVLSTVADVSPQAALGGGAPFTSTTESNGVVAPVRRAVTAARVPPRRVTMGRWPYRR